MKTELGHGAEGILIVKCPKEGHYIDKQDEYLILKTRASLITITTSKSS